MLVVECPISGAKTPIPKDRPDEITCSGCGKTLNLQEAETEKDSCTKAGLLATIKETAANAASSVSSFVKRHPRVVIGVIVGVLGTAGAIVGIQKLRESSDERSEDNASLIPEQNNNEIASRHEDTCDESDSGFTDWDYLSYLSDSCYNCGAPLTTAVIPSHGKTAAMNTDIGSVHVAEPSTKIGIASMTTDFAPF